MNFVTRLVGISVLLLFIFVVAALAAQSWLRQQGQHLRVEAIEAKRAQLVAILQAHPPQNGQWTPAEQGAVGQMLGGHVGIHTGAAPAATDPQLLTFEQPLADGVRRVNVAFSASPLNRLLMAYQRVTIGLLFFGFALLAVGAFFAALMWRAAPVEALATEKAGAVRADIGHLSRLAETSVAQGAELSRERDGRRRAEEDAQLKEKLLSQSLDAKVRLGHDLHDGIIQSLYAAGLTIESVRTLIRVNPEEADRRLAQCVQNLNATIRDVRAYITGLAPENLRQAGFTHAVEALIHEFRGDRPISFELKIDDEATAALTASQRIETLQIVREAVSNSLRHGGATSVTVRLHQVDQEFCLLVQDNGRGFDAGHSRAGGFGLGNMRARADRIGGTVRVESQPAAGTRVIVTLPLAIAAA